MRRGRHVLRTPRARAAAAACALAGVLWAPRARADPRARCARAASRVRRADACRAVLGWSTASRTSPRRSRGARGEVRGRGARGEVRGAEAHAGPEGREGLAHGKDGWRRTARTARTARWRRRRDGRGRRGGSRPPAMRSRSAARPRRTSVPARARRASIQVLASTPPARTRRQWIAYEPSARRLSVDHRALAAAIAYLEAAAPSRRRRACSLPRASRPSLLAAVECTALNQLVVVPDAIYYPLFFGVTGAVQGLTRDGVVRAGARQLRLAHAAQLEVLDPGAARAVCLPRRGVAGAVHVRDGQLVWNIIPRRRCRRRDGRARRRRRPPAGGEERFVGKVRPTRAAEERAAVGAREKRE